MGVQGLTTYVEGNRQFFQDVKFRDGRLVIDGCSLYYSLYFKHGLEQQRGGDYDAFSCLLSQFFSALAACSIQSYVVLDGGMDPSDKKFSTLRQRLQSKIKEAESLSHGRNGFTLPILTRKVFIQVLTQQGVPLVQCPAEADWEIACLARQWGCPVMTNDSDFYVFDLPGGYLPFRFFQWTNLNGKAAQQYISARRYTTNRLCLRFGGMNRELLPLCAVLAGNDYVTPKGTDTLLAMMDLTGLGGGGGGGGAGGGGGRGKGKTASSRIERLLLWLSSFSGPGAALEEVVRLMGGGAKRGGSSKFSSVLQAGMQEYHLTPQSSLAVWFSGGNVAPGGQAAWPDLLPECLSWGAAQARLAPQVLDVLLLRRVMLHPQVENSKLESSHSSARAIRQAIYGILLYKGGLGKDNQIQAKGGSGQGVKGPAGGVQAKGVTEQENFDPGKRGRGGRGHRGGGGGQGGAGRAHDQSSQVQKQGASAEAVQAESAGAPVCVEEYDRLDLNLKKSLVEVHRPRTPLGLDTLSQAPLEVCLAVLLDVLGVKEAVLAPVPPHLRLAVGVTGFWMREARPAPSLPQVQALLLGMVYGELAWNNQPGVPLSNWTAERNVWTGLDRLRVRPGERRGMDVGVAHGFSQWQACLWTALCLNQLLLLPLPEPVMSWVFSGSLVHGLIRSLRGGRPAESFLPQRSLSGQLYCTLLDAVQNCNSTTPHRPSSAPGRRKRGSRSGRRGKGRGAGRGGGGGERGTHRTTEEINNRFALLMSEEFDDDDE